MAQVIGVRFKDTGKIYYFDPRGLSIEEGQYVVVETVRGVECGQAAMGPKEISDERIAHPLKAVVRIADDNDIGAIRQKHEKEKKAFDYCAGKISRHGLDMKLIDVEYSFDGSKILFYFTSEGRVDFRELVKDLASMFKTRIELRQIGVRDEARMLGGLGVCGKPFCCSTFLEEFQPVSIKMAKEQGLSLNPAKISGTCGRLMCCLKYEQPAYEELNKITPRNGSFVETPDGRGKVIETNVISGNLRVILESDTDTAAHTYHRDKVKMLERDRRPGQDSKPHDKGPRQ